MGREFKLKKLGNLLVPDQVAEKIGLGCPKHDDHELVPANQRDHNVTEIITQFRAKHRDCGELETLEVRNGELYVTGKVPALIS